MDAVAAYYDWIRRLVNFFIIELEEIYGTKFDRDEEMTLGATDHSKQMMLKGYPYQIIGEFTGPTLFEKIEFVQDGIAFYNQSSIEQTLKKMLYDILNSINPDFRPCLRHYRFIGVGIALRELHGEIFLYATLRLRLE